jgi:glycerol kinase
VCMSKFIMAIDQGTTGTTAVVLDQGGSLVAKVNTEYKQIFPKPGWVEHDPEDIWASVKTSVAGALKKASIDGKEIAAIGITNQRETVLIWDRKTDKPIHNAIVWQCRRTQDFCAQLKRSGKEKMIRRKTGLVTDPYFSGSKVRWLLKNVKGSAARAKKGELAVGTIDTFLLWRLTKSKSHKTDVTNASRTMLMNIYSGKWDKDLLKLFSVPEKLLPEICDSSGEFGVTEGLDFLPDGIPITGIAGDQQAALFGQTCFATGEAKCTYGTGSFLLLNTGTKAIQSKYKLLTTIAWRLPGEKIVYALEGSAFICGAAVRWLRDGLGFINSSSEVEDLAKSVESSDGVEFVPALTGQGAPYWWPEARGLITGITRGTTKAHLARATLEAMALQNCDLLIAMQKDLGKKLQIVKVDGGACANDLLMQLQADYLGTQVCRPEQIETTAIGAAYLAGLGVGFWSSQKDLQKIWKLNKQFKSKMSAKERSLRMESWHTAVEKNNPRYLD